MKKFLKRTAGLLTAAALGLSAFAGMPALKQTASAAADNYKFDFGGGGTASGYTGVSATTAYSASLGYGFNTPGNMANVAAAGSGALSDAVRFVTYGTNTDNTFNVDLAKGLYQVSVWLGNTTRTSVAAEGVFQIINMTGNNAYHTFQIPVTDGQLNINCTAGKEGYQYTLSAMTVTKLSDNPTMKPTIWVCGDSTVCNYYPLDTSVQAGWAQMLPDFVDKNTYEVRNLAASGQYAKGFLDGGQFAPIEKYGKAGDYYIISIGINDTNYSNADEYTQVVTQMTQKAKALGMKVILVKQQGRADDISRSSLLTGRWFGTQLDAIGAAENVQVVDLFTLWQNYCLSIGQDAVYKLYMDGDKLHINRAGATILAKLTAEAIEFGSAAVSTVEGAAMSTTQSYMIQNVNSGLYLDVAGGTAANGTNVQQWGATGAQANNTWKFIESGKQDGYYYICSMVGDGKTYLLDVDYGKTEDGTNIGIYASTDSDAQLYKFSALSNGEYAILTKVSADKSGIAVADNDTGSGANIIETTYAGANSQKWKLVPVNLAADVTPTAMQGDVNGDGVLNVYDMQALKAGLLYSFRNDTAKSAADINGDGTPTVADLILLSQFVTRQITALPALTAARYYAVDASYLNGASETTNTGFAGAAYLNLNNETGSYVEWTLNVPAAGNYLVNFRIANGSTANRQMKIEVNAGSTYWVQDFLTTESWTTWTDRGIVLPLTAGKNVIRATSFTADGGPNIDYITLNKTEEPVAEPYDPAVIVTTPVSSNPTVYIAGDSTVQTYRASYAPQQGWGAYLGDYFDASTVTVSNHAIAGRSSKSFYDNGRLTTILDAMKEGDYLLVQFGINDSAASNAERYAPVCGNVTNPTDGSFEFYINKYVEGALAKGGTPVLVTTVIGLKAYSNGKFVNSYGNYCQAMKDIAAHYKIPCIDLNTLMVNHYNSIGYDAAYNYHLISTELSTTDMTHFTETGANAVAKLVAQAIKDLNLPLSQKCTLN